MANAIPTLSVVSYKGSGNVTVHKLLTGTTLDPTQDGSDVLTGTLEAPTTVQNNSGNRIVEAFGLRLLLHGTRVYERDQGGAGTWGVVESAGSTTRITHSGLHLLFPAGVPTVAFLEDDGTDINKYTTTDGTTWTGPTSIGSTVGTLRVLGPSVVFRDSIAWLLVGASDGDVIIHDFKLGTTITPTVGVQINSSVIDLLVHKNKLFVCHGISTFMRISRLDGVAFTQIFSSGHFLTVSSVPTIFSDGEELILFFRQFSAGVNRVFAITDPTGTPVSSALGALDFIIAGLANVTSGFHKYVSIDPDPAQPTVYFWFNQGDNNSGNFDLFRYNYRLISHGAVSGGPFEVGESVLDQTSNATGRIMESSGTTLNLTDVVGTFGNGNVIQQTSGTNSGATATSSSLLTYQALTSLGTGIAKANFGLPHISSGGLDRIPAKGAARPQWDGLPAEVVGGRRRFFRIYGTGSVINLKMFHNVGEEAPATESTLLAVAVVSGAPATTPTFNASLNRLENFTPDDGASLYSVDQDAATDGIIPGTQHTVILDIA